jgi:hypothetical protein
MCPPAEHATSAGVLAGRAPVRVRPAPDVPWATYLDDDEPQQQQEELQHKAAATRDEAGDDRGMAASKGHMSGECRRHVVPHVLCHPLRIRQH